MLSWAFLSLLSWNYLVPWFRPPETTNTHSGIFNSIIPQILNSFFPALKYNNNISTVNFGFLNRSYHQPDHSLRDIIFGLLLVFILCLCFIRMKESKDRNSQYNSEKLVRAVEIKRDIRHYHYHFGHIPNIGAQEILRIMQALKDETKRHQALEPALNNSDTRYDIPETERHRALGPALNNSDTHYNIPETESHRALGPALYHSDTRYDIRETNLDADKVETCGLIERYSKGETFNNEKMTEKLSNSIKRTPKKVNQFFGKWRTRNFKQSPSSSNSY